MPRPEGTKQINVTMTAREKEELQDFCKKTGITMNAAMAKARSLLLLDSMRGRAQDQAGSIEEYELCLEKMLTLHRQAIERSIDARAAAELDVKGQLEGMQTLAEENKRLNADLQQEIADNRRLSELVKNQERQIKEMEQLQSEVKLCKKENKELREENMALNQKNNELQSKHNAEIGRIQNDNFEKLLKLMAAAGSKE